LRGFFAKIIKDMKNTDKQPTQVDGRISLGSPERFGFEWGFYSQILPESRMQLERWLGCVGLEHFKGKQVLDVGCGMGRNPYWMLKTGVHSITAVDIDDQSLAAARKNLSSFKNATVKKYSVYELSPEVLGQFDIVTCIGVLHHLADPRAALDRLWSCVSPEGELILWCYANHGNSVFLPVIDGLRFVGSRLPIRLTHRLAKLLTWIVWPAVQLLPWRVEYYKNLKQLSRINLESIIFDQIIPRIAHYWTDQDLEAMLKPLGGKVHLELVQGNSWSVRIIKPDALDYLTNSQSESWSSVDSKSGE
jgi:2-polyprenyl-3-methyl-5-hydroxy-6-metoxy-1,4-benzoquinol methylase